MKGCIFHLVADTPSHIQGEVLSYVTRSGKMSRKSHFDKQIIKIALKKLYMYLKSNDSDCI